MHRMLLALVVLSLLAFLPAAEPYNPPIKPASDEGVRAINGFHMPKGVEARLWAAEPLLPTRSLCFDEKGRCFVAETFRLHKGVTDNRRHMDGLRTTWPAARSTIASPCIASISRTSSTTYETEHDRVRLIEDTNGEGVADKATVFADGFHHAADGIGAGLLWRKGERLTPAFPICGGCATRRGKADVKKSLSTGYGVHVAFSGMTCTAGRDLTAESISPSATAAST